MYTIQLRQSKSLKEAGDLLAANPDAKLLAGGMTLIPTLKARLAQPSHLIDIGGLAELARHRSQGRQAQHRRRRPSTSKSRVRRW